MATVHPSRMGLVPQDSSSRRRHSPSPRRRSRPTPSPPRRSRSRSRDRESRAKYDHNRGGDRGDRNGYRHSSHHQDDHDRGRRRSPSLSRNGDGGERRASPQYDDYRRPRTPPREDSAGASGAKNMYPNRNPNHAVPRGGGGSDFFESRRMQRDNATVDVWPSSPKAPVRELSPKRDKSSGKKSKRRYSPSDTDSSEEAEQQKRKERKGRKQKDRKKEERRDKKRKRSHRRFQSDDEGDEERHHRSSRKKSYSRSASPTPKNQPTSSRRRSRSRSPPSDDDWVVKNALGTMAPPPPPPVPAFAEPNMTYSRDMGGERGEDDDDDDDAVGPQPAQKANAKRVDERAYGGALLRGEGSAMAAFLQDGTESRIPRRGEIGLTSDEIAQYEDVGYVMSGSRHRRMNAVRIRKENQVISAEEKRGILKLQKEERERREAILREEFSELVHESLKERTMPERFSVDLDTPVYKGKVSCPTGLFINGKFVEAVEGGTIDIVNPSTGKVLTKVAAATSADVDIAVEAARKAYKTSWGLKVPGSKRGEYLNKLADLLQANIDEFAALECLNVGKPWSESRGFDLELTLKTIRYYAGWADKVEGRTIETNDTKLAYTRHEPYGVVGQIVPWNYPITMVSWKIAPALATGNVVVLKPSEITPLTALKLAELVVEAGFPPGVVNIIPGYGATAGAAISLHPHIRKIAFTGSTLTGRKIQEASAKSNLKVVTLELGGKSPNIIFDDADLEQAVKWSSIAIFSNSGQVCTAGSRIFVQEGIYDAFIKAFSAAAQNINHKTGDPFAEGTVHGPVVSQTQLDRVLGYIKSAKDQGAKAFIGGERHDISDGYYVKPTIFTDCTPDMKVVQEEVFGPVAAVVKFKTEEEAIEMANDTEYGLASAVFTENVGRAIRVSNALEAGMTWVNCNVATEYNVPFGGYKQSGVGRELGSYAIST
ncbi:hypothetical protein D9757_009381 [Collybiopsis confluens]|uniref:Aldehyde dehydrogenase domain-containing protein n=1 Tax=Collybiopsis confluens TaxID=2823264 RepID=A0A8H5M219_9AGAR|nr:hypothetical protein D9757_009381 [Collybiopsis confluens]